MLFWKLSNHTARTPGTPRCSLHRSLMLCTAKFWGGNAAATAASAAATLYTGATKEPGRRTRWRQNSPARRHTWRRPPPSTFAYGLYPKQQLDAGHRLRLMCDRHASAAPNTKFFLHSNFLLTIELLTTWFEEFLIWSFHELEPILFDYLLKIRRNEIRNSLWDPVNSLAPLQ